MSDITNDVLYGKTVEQMNYRQFLFLSRTLHSIYQYYDELQQHTQKHRIPTLRPCK